MRHRGEIIEKAVRESGTSIAELARRLKKSRRHIYNIFNNSKIDIETTLQIGKIIHHDFKKDIPEINASHINPDQTDIFEQNKTVEYWKEKYFELLERHNQLLEKVYKKKK